MYEMFTLMGFYFIYFCPQQGWMLTEWLILGEIWQMIKVLYNFGITSSYYLNVSWLQLLALNNKLII